jgi:hypothetical protein
MASGGDVFLFPVAYYETEAVGFPGVNALPITILR